ncbi:MAG: histidine--tRNA ligase [bacterium]|nr:histidine--tRNA ligase [bacterium]
MTDANYLPPKGFRDIAPDEALKRKQVIALASKLAQSFGFVPIETPTIEYKKTLMGKYGDEADRLIFDFTDRGGRQVALRYDQTVPLARYINRFRPKLPFKRFQIQPSFRAEKPQKGRYREFTQIDFDIVGDDSFISDAEILWLTAEFFQQLGLKVSIYYNSRQLLYQTLAKAKIDKDKFSTIAQTIDKLDKTAEDKVKQELAGKGLTPQTIKVLWQQLKQVKPDSRLAKTIDIIKPLVDVSFIFSPFLVRGLDYYTGLIFEVKLDGLASSLGGGGRYNKLIRQANDYLPAVGIGIGLDRITDLLQAQKNYQVAQADIVILVLSDAVFGYAFQAAASLRKQGLKVFLYPKTDKVLKKGFKYAQAIKAPKVAFIGEDEKAGSYITIKDTKTNTQKKVKLNLS